jgi:hypothetical protein
MFPLFTGTDHPKRNGSEQDKQPNNNSVQHPEDTPLNVARQLLSEAISKEPEDQDGEVERRILTQRRVSRGKR